MTIISTLFHCKIKRAFEPASSGFRKVIIATNIAETSVTIDGVRFVIDCLLAKMKYFDVKSGIDALLTCPIGNIYLFFVFLMLFVGSYNYSYH